MAKNKIKNVKKTDEKTIKKPQFFPTKNYDFRSSAIIATLIAVAFLGSTIFLFVKNMEKDQQVERLQKEISSLHDTVKTQDLK